MNNALLVGFKISTRLGSILNKHIEILAYSGGEIRSMLVCRKHTSRNKTKQERHLPCTMVEREKLRDQKSREAFPKYFVGTYKSINRIHIGSRFLTPYHMNDSQR